MAFSDNTVPLCPRLRAEQPTLTILGDSGGGDIGVQRLGERMMAGHGVMLAAFLVQSQPPARALRPKVLDLHVQRGRDAREGIGEGGDQRAVAKIAHRVGRDRVEQLAPVGRVEHRRLADLHHVLRAAHGRRRVCRHDLAGDQPIEQHAHGGELLLHGRRRMGPLERLYIGGDIERPDRRQRQAAIIAPSEKLPAGSRISAARVLVPDVRGEEFDITPSGRLRLRRRSAPAPDGRRARSRARRVGGSREDGDRVASWRLP